MISINMFQVCEMGIVKNELGTKFFSFFLKAEGGLTGGAPAPQYSSACSAASSGSRRLLAVVRFKASFQVIIR